ncbi:D-alanyl-D-alanine carboxypeptidase [Chryseobacterium shigense]|uniref:D-alanyl-D-alanine carboxypeptidase n=1 Tax=Chryseobacterium shigense TaxID=297244 RepID=A0A1N7K3A9_9FLAO|nr:serine hydrolase domain-containing protein [Chryseobacterium shigense]PQA91092.1 D-alanyl-D-alanine carboxypeptidase [Chryseobacterium shigense]SIS56082.1 D-alanyl-D-alanine carboxypeptidase [Chryseobacterium shigense]
MILKKLFFVAAASISCMALSQNANKQKLMDYLDSLSVHHRVMGSFAIAENDRPTFLKTTGFSDVAKLQKTNINTQYRIGSISKTFTAVLVMKAVEEKKLSLDAKLSTWYPEIENADKITLEHLLQHRSGIHNLTDEQEYWTYNTKPQTEQALVSMIKKYKSDFSPGTQYEYSNSNYILLAFILEKAYKKTYAQLLKTKITSPLKLTLTEVGAKIDPSKNQALSYTYSDGSYQPWQETDMSIPVGAGDIISTPTELLKFIIALENGKLVSTNSLSRMKNFIDSYGYGVAKVPFEKYSGYGHNGGIDQFRSVLYYFPELKTAVSFITNQSDYNNNEISIKMLETSIGKDFKMPNFRGVSIAAETLKKYEGLYKAEGFPLDIKIFQEEGKLKGQATGQGEFPLEAVSETEFKFEMAGIKMKFNAEKATMDFSQGANNFTFKKQ